MTKDYRATIIANMARHMRGLDFPTIASRVVGMLILQKGNLGRYQSVLETAFEAHAVALRLAPAAPPRECPLDWSTFAGPTRNIEWKPDDQDLIYTALNYRNDDYGDKDDDAGQQIVERLLSAWQQAEMTAGMVIAHRHELLEQVSAQPAGRLKVYLLEAEPFLVPGRIQSLHADMASLNEEAATLVNQLRKEVALPTDATPEDWQAKSLQARYARAEKTGLRIDAVNGGNVRFTEMNLTLPAQAEGGR